MAGGKKCSKGCRCGKHQKGGKFNLGTALNVASALLPVAQQLAGNGLRGGRLAPLSDYVKKGGRASQKASASRKNKQVRTRGSGLRLQGSGPLASVLASLLPF